MSSIVSARVDSIRSLAESSVSKVPHVTLAFWIVKICATTLGETGGDALSMTLNLGYAISTLVFVGFLSVTLGAQLLTTRYRPTLYWLVVVATTTVGTTTSDYLDRTLGLGYVKSSVMLFCAVIAVLAIWRTVSGTIAVDKITSRTNEFFYWLTIVVSNTLGTALGDFTASTTGLGFERGALVFGALLAVVAAARYLTKIPGAILFWAAYVLTRPLGATLGDTLTKSHEAGGLNLDRISSSLVIATVMALIVAATVRGVPTAGRRRSEPASCCTR
jgi:uncharacterized membrane-anchored protein